MYRREKRQRLSSTEGKKEEKLQDILAIAKEKEIAMIKQIRDLECQVSILKHEMKGISEMLQGKERSIPLSVFEAFKNEAQAAQKQLEDQRAELVIRDSLLYRL